MTYNQKCIESFIIYAGVCVSSHLHTIKMGLKCTYTMNTAFERTMLMFKHYYKLIYKKFTESV